MVGRVRGDDLERRRRSINRQLFRRRLVVSLGGSYSRLDGLIVNDAFSANATRDWKIGKLDFTLGASVFDTQTEGSFLVEQRPDPRRTTI